MAAPARPSAALPLRVRVLLILSAVVLVWASFTLYGEEPERSTLEVTGKALGTTWSVKLASSGLTPDQDRATAREIALRIGRVDALMSTWQPESQLSQWNASRSTEPVPVAAETLAVFDIARAVSEASGGAFDVTVGPLVQAWGFGSEGRKQPPDPVLLAQLRSRVGYQQLEIDLEAGTLAKRRAELEADLSAVAKGFAVDEVGRGLESLGHASYLVEIGGELRARGTHLDGEPWRVAIETPNPGGRSIHKVVELRELSMATSGDYRNYYEVEGRRISHTIDPRTGAPIEHRLVSVTVLHPEAAWADAWATALNVLGPEAGYELAVAQDLAAYLILRSATGAEDDYEIRMTPRFEPFLVQHEDGS